MWLKHLASTTRLIIKFLIAGSIGVLVTGLAVFVYVLDARPGGPRTP